MKSSWPSSGVLDSTKHRRLYRRSLNTRFRTSLTQSTVQMFIPAEIVYMAPKRSLATVAAITAVLRQKYRGVSGPAIIQHLHHAPVTIN